MYYELHGESKAEHLEIVMKQVKFFKCLAYDAIDCFTYRIGDGGEHQDAKREQWY